MNKQYKFLNLIRLCALLSFSSLTLAMHERFDYHRSDLKPAAQPYVPSKAARRAAQSARQSAIRQREFKAEMADKRAWEAAAQLGLAEQLKQANKDRLEWEQARRVAERDCARSNCIKGCKAVGMLIGAYLLFVSPFMFMRSKAGCLDEQGNVHLCYTPSLVDSMRGRHDWYLVPER